MSERSLLNSTFFGTKCHFQTIPAWLIYLGPNVGQLGDDIAPNQLLEAAIDASYGFCVLGTN